MIFEDKYGNWSPRYEGVFVPPQRAGYASKEFCESAQIRQRAGGVMNPNNRNSRPMPMGYNLDPKASADILNGPRSPRGGRRKFVNAKNQGQINNENFFGDRREISGAETTQNVRGYGASRPADKRVYGPLPTN